jgi:choline dehydrogenase-like flavoprotein
MNYDVIVIGSGAGGSAVAFHLTQTGKRVLLLEKGLALPRDGSTLDVGRVLREGAFLSDEPWIDGNGRTTVPEEHFNLGGKTKWYGAALLRFAPHEFEPDPAHQCRGWPVGHAALTPFYEEAEQLLGVRPFAVEPDTRRLVAGLRRRDPQWRKQQLALGLSPEILAHPDEARHFDGFASVRGLKADAEGALLARVAKKPNLDVLAGKAVAKLLPAAADATRVAGVECEDGSRYTADTVVLAAGALHSPRLLQGYLEGNGLAATLPCYASVGRNYKSHVLTALMAWSHRPVTDVLCKTMLLCHPDMPHSTVQTLGGNLTEEIVRAQFPGFVPDWIARPIARRFYGFFLQTEDGSHPDNRILAHAGSANRPQIDYDLDRIAPARQEHERLVRTLRSQLLRVGYLTVAKSIPVSGTAHACGTLAAGSDPRSSVVDGDGKVHGMANLYVGDGSVLPRSSRVNPALSIYAWGLRLGARLSTLARGAVAAAPSRPARAGDAAREIPRAIPAHEEA